MISGIRVNDTCITEFNNMKIRKTCRWIIFVIENCEIIIHSKGATTTLTELVESIDKNDKIQCAYVVFDAVNKIHFFMYARESSNSRDRMTYASSKQALLKKIEGVNVLTSVIESVQDVADFNATKKILPSCPLVCTKYYHKIPKLKEKLAKWKCPLK